MQNPYVDHTNHIRQREQHERHRRRITKIKEAKRGAVNVKTDRLRRETWPTFRQNKNLIEHAEQIHRAQQQHDEDRRVEQRQRHVPKRLPTTRTIYQRRFVRFLRNRLQAREQHEKHKRRPLPNVDRDNREHRELRRRGPRQTLSLESKAAQRAVDRTEVRIEHQTPNNTNDHTRQNHRHEQARAKQSSPAHFSIEEERETQPQRKLATQRRNRVDQCMDHRGQEEVVGNKTREVSDTPERAARCFLLQADRDRIKERVDRKRKEHRESRRDEERGQQPLASILRA